MSAHGRSEVLIPQRIARRAVQWLAHGRSEVLIPQRIARRAVQ
jgi:hypothetical protein